MIKSKLNTFLSQKLGHLSEKKIHNATNHIIKLLSEALTSGKRIEIRGFGSFSLHFRPPRQAFNPKTGKRVTTQGKNIPHFKPGKILKEGIDESKHQFPIGEDEQES